MARRAKTLFEQEIAAFEGDVAAEKARLEARATSVGHGPKKYQLLKKIRQLETASHVKDWLSSPGLQPPRSD
jgi:hypothetical protein